MQCSTALPVFRPIAALHVTHKQVITLAIGLERKSLAVRRPVAGADRSASWTVPVDGRKIGAGDAYDLCHGLHREPSFPL